MSHRRNVRPEARIPPQAPWWHVRRWARYHGRAVGWRSATRATVETAAALGIAAVFGSVPITTGCASVGMDKARDAAVLAYRHSQEQCLVLAEDVEAAEDCVYRVREIWAPLVRALTIGAELEGER